MTMTLGPEPPIELDAILDYDDDWGLTEELFEYLEASSRVASSATGPTD